MSEKKNRAGPWNAAVNSDHDDDDDGGDFLLAVVPINNMP